MIVVDENIPEDQCLLLRNWRIRIRQIGRDVGLLGMKDQQQIVPLLHSLDYPTFLTCDLGFFRRRWRHERYALICFAVKQSEVASFIKRLLRHPRFDSKQKRLGTVVRVSVDDIRVWELGAENQVRLPWNDEVKH